MEFSTEKLAENYKVVQNRIVRAADKAQRDPEDVQLVAVTKYVGAEVIRALFALGCRHFGESRPQVLWEKANELKELPIEWHQIGHLQTNKVRRSLPHISLLHSGDSLKLLKVVNEESEKLGRVQPVLCELNISGDETKHGFTKEQLLSAIESISDLKHIDVRGLMAMASRQGGADQARRDFGRLESFREQIRNQVPESFSLGELSIGMSGDFEEAIACGATLVRIGSVLFEGVMREN